LTWDCEPTSDFLQTPYSLTVASTPPSPPSAVVFIARWYFRTTRRVLTVSRRAGPTVVRPDACSAAMLSLHRRDGMPYRACTGGVTSHRAAALLRSRSLSPMFEWRCAVLRWTQDEAGGDSRAGSAAVSVSHGSPSPARGWSAWWRNPPLPPVSEVCRSVSLGGPHLRAPALAAGSFPLSGVPWVHGGLS